MLFMMCLLVYILLIWKCVSFSLISTLFQSVCKYCLFNVVCECNYCFYSLLLQVCNEGNAFVSTVRLMLTLGYIMYVMCINCFICNV